MAEKEDVRARLSLPFWVRILIFSPPFSIVFFLDFL